MASDRQQFSARFRNYFGPHTEAPVQRVRDVLICATGGSDGDVDEFLAHPPIARELRGQANFSGDPVDLGHGLVIDRLSDDDSELVMNACTPRGHYFAPIRQFGQLYSFVLEVDLGKWEDQRFDWDPDGIIGDALALSRLVRDNAYSTQYAARIADYEDGEQLVSYTLSLESKHVYRFRRDRDWLDVEDGHALRRLLAAYRDPDTTLLPRVRRAMWRAEYSSWIRWADLALPIIVSGLEALLKTERRNATAQFTTRVAALAREVDIHGVEADLCERMYDARSDWVHGTHVRLFSTGPEAQDASSAPGPRTEDQRSAMDEIAQMQEILRRAVRRSIEDADFRATFSGDNTIRARWGRV